VSQEEKEGEFNMRFDVLDKVLSNLQLNTAVISGGSILSLINKKEIRDIDVFCSFEEAEQVNQLIAMYGVPKIHWNSDNSGEYPRPPLGDDPYAPCSFTNLSKYVDRTCLLNIPDSLLVDLTILKIKSEDITRAIPEIFDLDICTAMYTLDAGLIKTPIFLRAVELNESNVIKPVYYLNTLARMAKLYEAYGILLGKSFSKLYQKLVYKVRVYGNNLLETVQNKNLHYAQLILAS
jgi:hypothetical protein